MCSRSSAAGMLSHSVRQFSPAIKGRIHRLHRRATARVQEIEGARHSCRFTVKTTHGPRPASRIGVRRSCAPHGYGSAWRLIRVIRRLQKSQAAVFLSGRAIGLIRYHGCFNRLPTFVVTIGSDTPGTRVNLKPSRVSRSTRSALMTGRESSEARLKRTSSNVSV